MTAIRYQPGASYEEQLRIWANGNEDEHRLAVFLEESPASSRPLPMTSGSKGTTTDIARVTATAIRKATPKVGVAE